jgi:hypothetical protein
LKQCEVGHKFQPAAGHLGFAKGDFIKHKLSNKEFVLLALGFPPVFGHLLACRLE